MAEIIQEVEKRIGKRVRFILVGWTETDFARTLEERARKAGITNQVIFHPPVANKQMPPYFWLANVYALTSTYDILPIVILEAMANKLAVVASKNGGASEIIFHGRDGLLIDPYQIGEVEESLISVLVDKKLRHSLGKEAYRKIEQQYTWERVAKLLSKQYEDIIEKGRR